MKPIPARNHTNGDPAISIKIAPGVTLRLTIKAAFTLADGLVDAAEIAAVRYPSKRPRKSRRA